MQHSDKTSEYTHNWPEWIIFTIIMLLVVFIRIRLSEMPLERDEGEYAYAAQLILNGIPPVQETRLPGIYVAYALIMSIFGQTHVGIHLGLIWINLMTSVLLAMIGTKLWNTSTGLIAGASFLCLTLSQHVEGLSAQNEHFIVLTGVCGLLLLVRARSLNVPSCYLSSGLMMGLTFLMKQPGVTFILFALFWIFSSLWITPRLSSGKIFLIASFFQSAPLFRFSDFA